jgi:putative ABC transport system permease protein
MAWRNIMIRKIQTIITLIIIAVGVALTLSTLIMASGLKEGIVEASKPYGMIVGSKGSANQLVFNTIFLMDTPLGNLPLSFYESLKTDERVKQAVPFALGDSYKGYRLVGTTGEFFELRSKPSDPPYFQLLEGSFFEHPFEAVIGHNAAEATGLQIGDTFRSGHGVVQALEDDDSHAQHPYTVVGILDKTNAPADLGIYVSMESYWISHDQMEGLEEHEEGAHEELEELEELEEQEEEQGVTAVLVNPYGYIGLMQLYNEINNGNQAQAVFPGQVLAKVFDMMGNGELVLQYISYVVIGMAALTIFLSLYSSTLERRRSIAILRTLGARRKSIFAIVMLESFLVVSFGSLIGLALSYVVSAGITSVISGQSTIAIALTFSWDHISVISIVCLIGIIAGIIPAILAYRTEVVRNLN